MKNIQPGDERVQGRLAIAYAKNSNESKQKKT